MNNFKTSQLGLNLIKHYEGCSLVGYQKVYNGKKDPITIGYGHTGMVNGKAITVGQKITLADAEIILKMDLLKFEKDVISLVKKPITQSKFDALVSFAFNVGPDIDADTIAEGLGDSTLLKYVNAGNFTAAANEFIKWNKAGGIVLNGLTCRRMSEAMLFSTGKLVFYRYDQKTQRIVPC